MRVIEIKASDVRSGQRVANRGQILRINRGDEVIEILFQGEDRYKTFFPEKRLQVIDAEDGE